MPRPHGIDFLRHDTSYYRKDGCYYRRDATEEFDWAIPKKYFKALKTGEIHHLPPDLPFAVPLIQPLEINKYGWEPRKKPFKPLSTMIKKRGAAIKHWYDHECFILYNLLQRRLKEFHSPSARDHVEHSWQTAQIRCYKTRSNPWQILSKMHRLGMLKRDWRICDHYINHALSGIPGTYAHGHHGYHADEEMSPPMNRATVSYLFKYTDRKTIPDRNLRYAIQYALQYAGGYHDRRAYNPFHIHRSDYRHLFRYWEKHTFLDKKSQRSGKQLAKLTARRCGLHCHSAAKKERCKNYVLKAYHVD